MIISDLIIFIGQWNIARILDEYGRININVIHANHTATFRYPCEMCTNGFWIHLRFCIYDSATFIAFQKVISFRKFWPNLPLQVVRPGVLCCLNSCLYSSSIQITTHLEVFLMHFVSISPSIGQNVTDSLIHINRFCMIIPWLQAHQRSWKYMYVAKSLSAFIFVGW